MARESITAPEHPRRALSRQVEQRRALLDELDTTLDSWSTLTTAQQVAAVRVIGRVVVAIGRLILDLIERGDIDVRRRG